MLLWVNTDETAMIWMQILSIFYVFNVLVSEKLIFDCCFIDDFLMRYWWKMEISKQTLLISKDLIVLIFYFLRPPRCLILYFLMNLWTNFDETLLILMQTLIKNILLKLLMFRTLKFHVVFRCLFDGSSNKHCWKSKDFDANIHDQKLFFLLVSETLVFLCCFTDDSLIIHDVLMMEEQKYR